MEGYVILGPKTALGNEVIFRGIKEGWLWTGLSTPSKFWRAQAQDTAVPAKWFIIDKGTNFKWYNTLERQKKEVLELTESYYEHPERYPRYEEYDAINIDRVKDIPYDYYGPMGVPITFLDGYYPDFEVEYMLGGGKAVEGLRGGGSEGGWQGKIHQGRYKKKDFVILGWIGGEYDLGAKAEKRYRLAKQQKIEGKNKFLRVIIQRKV